MRLHPLSGAIRGLQRGVVLGSFAFFPGAMGSNLALPIDSVFVLAPLGFLLGASYQVAYYYRFSYELTPDTLDVTSGVLGRQEREIPYRRIQNVDVSQNLLHRLLGVAVLRIETAGGATTEAELNFVDLAEAKRIQREVRSRRQRISEADEPGDGETPTDESEARAAGTGPTTDVATDAEADSVTTGSSAITDDVTPLFALTPKELVLLAVASFRPGAIVALFFGLPFAEDVLGRLLVPILGEGIVTDPGGTLQTSPAPLVVLAGLSLFVLGAIVALAASALFTILGYYDFLLGRQGDDLVYERGLLQRYSGSIPVDKIQTVSIRETLPMRLLGYAALTVETAGYSPGQESQGAQSAIPLAERDRVVSFARELESFSDLTFSRPPKRARRRYVVRFFLVYLLVLGLLVVATRITIGLPATQLWPLVALTLPLVPVAGHYRWKHRGYHVGERHVVLRTGFWRRSTRVVPYYRLQTVLRERTIFQRRLDLAHLTCDTATSSTLGSRDATAFDIEAEDARRLFETCRERLQEQVRERTGSRGANSPD